MSSTGQFNRFKAILPVLGGCLVLAGCRTSPVSQAYHGLKSDDPLVGITSSSASSRDKNTNTTASRGNASKDSLSAMLGEPAKPKTQSSKVSRPLWKKSRDAERTEGQNFSKDTNQQTLASLDHGTSEKSVQILRPVPVGRTLSPVASEWSQVVPVAGETPKISDGAPLPPIPGNLPPVVATNPIAPSLDGSSEVALSTQGTNGGEKSLPKVPTIIVQSDPPKTLTPPKADPPLTGDLPEKKKFPLLPQPRSKSGASKNSDNSKESNVPTDKKANDKKNGGPPPGWPEIPNPVITNPPHAPREFQKHALSSYIIEPPDILRIDGLPALFDRNLPLEGPHLVRPDGTIGLGTFGAVFVAGMTLDQAKNQIIQTIMKRQSGSENKLEFKDFWEGIRVDVAAFNSKHYYIIADGGGYGETVVRLPITGNETVLDAISQIQGLPAVASKKRIWVARATPGQQSPPVILPVDWCGIVQRGGADTNYQLFPGDRIYVNSDSRIRVDSHLAKILSPIERLFGVTLLGATTVNAINGNNGFGNMR